MNELSFANELENEQETVSGDGMISVAIIVGIIMNMKRRSSSS